MSDALIPVPAAWRERAFMNKAQYEAAMRRRWRIRMLSGAKRPPALTWMTPFSKAGNWSFDADNLSIKWFEDGALNVAANCLDRHLEKRGGQTAIIWEGDNPAESRHISYRELHAEVCRFANVLKARGVKKGDRVTLYLPMIPEAAYAMLACARIGAVHSVVFGAFRPTAWRAVSRIAIPGSSLRPMKACVAASLFR